MDHSKVLFWNVDTQKDFIEPDGKLYVPGAETLKDKLKLITRLAGKYHIRVVNTADYHYINSPELDKSPDMVNTFPEHCMAGTEGAEFIKETNPYNPTIFDWDQIYQLPEELSDNKKYRNLVIRKDAFDVFKGSPHTEKILELLKPEAVFVYGVTTNICVDFAVKGLSKRVNKVYVIKDAIKELPGIPLPFGSWAEMNVDLIGYEELVNMIIK